MNSIWREMLFISPKSEIRCPESTNAIWDFRLRTLYTLLFLLFLGSAVFSQPKDTVSGFQFDVLSFETKNFSPDSCRVDIFVAVPYSWLTFLNATEKYVADYEIGIYIFTEENDSLVRTRTQALTVALASSEWEKLHELDLTRADASQYSFNLKQSAEYQVRITVKDLSTHKELSGTKNITTLKFPASSPSISDILLYKSKEGTRITPHIGDDISVLKIDEAGLFCELYNAPQSTPFWLMQRAVSTEDNEEIIRSSEVLVSSGQKRMPVFLPFVQEDLWSGKYLLELFILPNASDTLLPNFEALKTNALAYRSRRVIISGFRGVPISGLNLDDAIAQLGLIASGNAYDSLMRATTKQEKRKAIKGFWDTMNWYQNQQTTRPMETFYRRVQYANEHFKGMGEGWRTDRGKIYIMLGAPTSIEKHSYDANNRPYEIWRYYDLNQQYYFSDQFMTGDFRLASLPPSPGTFLWQRESY